MLHAVLPGCLVYSYFAHNVHAEAALVFAYVSIPHNVHAALASLANEPGAQRAHGGVVSSQSSVGECWHACTGVLAFLYFPAVHAAQRVLFSCTRYSPCTHAEHVGCMFGEHEVFAICSCGKSHACAHERHGVCVCSEFHKSNAMKLPCAQEAHPCGMPESCKVVTTVGIGCVERHMLPKGFNTIASTV